MNAMNATQQAKNQLRQKILSTRKAMSDLERQRESQLLAEQLFALPAWQSARYVGLFASAPDEVATDSIITKALKSGKIVALPKIQNSHLLSENQQNIATKYKIQNLTWYTITSLDDLEAGMFGIREPKIEAKNVKQKRTRELTTISRLELLVVPGVAFDIGGGRLGYGGGFYDRVLQDFQGQTVSLAFACQIVPQIPMEAHDKKIHLIITRSS